MNIDIKTADGADIELGGRAMAVSSRTISTASTPWCKTSRHAFTVCAVMAND